MRLATVRFDEFEVLRKFKLNSVKFFCNKIDLHDVLIYF